MPCKICTLDELQSTLPPSPSHFLGLCCLYSPSFDSTWGRGGVRESVEMSVAIADEDLN